MLLALLRRLLPGLFNVASATASGRLPATRRQPMRSVAIVEDNGFQRELLERMVIGAFPGCSCQVYPGPLAALEGIGAGQHVDLIISDVFMPGLDGFELAEQLRRILPDLRCILVTSHEAEDIPPGKASLADALLFKPVTQRMLSDALSRLN